jgi:hypothetical protein
MKTLDDIGRQLSAGEFEFSRHAFKRAIERNISDAEIRQGGSQARIIITSMGSGLAIRQGVLGRLVD